MVTPTTTIVAAVKRNDLWNTVQVTLHVLVENYEWKAADTDEKKQAVIRRAVAGIEVSPEAEASPEITL